MVTLCFSAHFVFVSFVSCDHWTGLSIYTSKFFSCWITFLLFSLRLFTKIRVNVFYIKGCIRFFSFFLVLFFCWFSTTFPSSFFFPDWPTRFLQLTKGAVTLFYDKQLGVSLFYYQQPCYTTMLHFSVINNSGERSHFFLWQTSSSTDHSHTL